MSENSSSTAVRVRGTAAPVALPLAIVALLASTALDHIDEQGSQSRQTAQALAHVSSLRPLAVCELLAAALFGLGVAAIIGSIKRRGAALANAAGVLGALGTAGMGMIGARHLFLYAQVDADPAHVARVSARLMSSAPAVPVLFFAAPIALVLLAIAGWRAGILPLPALGVVIVGFAADLSSSRVAQFAGLLCYLAGYAWLCVRLRTGERRTDTAPAPALV